MKKPTSDRLHIGCFDCPVEGWHNTDITPHIWITKIPYLSVLLHAIGKLDDRRLTQHRAGIFRKVHYLDLSKPMPYPENSFCAVFSSHVFEHLPRKVFARLLQELFRVLRPGGVMRVSVPDLDYFVQAYTSESADEFVKAVFEIDHSGDKNRHQWMYTECTLRKALEAAGFKNVKRCRYQEGECPDLNELDNRPEHSLFMEAVK